MSLAIHLFFFASLIFLLTVRTRTILAYYQQEEYDSRRFWGALLKVRLFDVVSTLAFLALYGLGRPFDFVLLALFLSSLVFLGVALRERRYKFKKALVMTERAKRLYAVALVFLILFLLAFAKLWSVFLPLVWQAAPVALMLANAVLVPFQNRINARYVKEAKQKLAETDLVRIGITGSFGKTTVKHILAQMLAVDAPVFYSRGSVNTVLGLTRHIRQRLQHSHKYFIAEMGAYGIGSIKRLCEFADPQHAIITAVGDAHTERFGSVANIAIAKSELAEWVCARGGIVVTTEDVMAFAPFADLRRKHPENFRVCGKGKDADTRIVAAEVVGEEWHIRLRFNGKKAQEIDLTLPVLGEHNVANIALVATLFYALKPEMVDRIAAVARTVEQIPHRLEKKEFKSGPLVLDDAYNSNERGFENAVAVLRNLADQRGGKAVLVTPGIAELGVEHERVHLSLGAMCGQKCDVVYVVNPARIQSFMQGVKGGAAEVVTVQSLSEAQRDIAARAFAASDVILYENDLPDLLEETRLL